MIKSSINSLLSICGVASFFFFCFFYFPYGLSGLYSLTSGCTIYCALYYCYGGKYYCICSWTYLIWFRICGYEDCRLGSFIWDWSFYSCSCKEIRFYGWGYDRIYFWTSCCMSCWLDVSWGWFWYWSEMRLRWPSPVDWDIWDDEFIWNCCCIWFLCRLNAELRLVIP